MSSSTPMPRPVGLRRLAGALTLLLLLPSPAWAHTSLRRSEPAKGSRHAVAPTRVSLWFTARPQVPFSRIRLFGPSGEVALGPIVADTGNALHAIIPSALASGEYRVQWQTASADGHPMRGDFAFTVAGAGDTAAPKPAARGAQGASSDAPEIPSEHRAARWMEFVALLTVLGALGFRHGVLPPLAARGVATADAADRARRLGQSVLVLYVIAAAVRLYSESVALHGAEVALQSGVLIPLLTSTTWGIGWLIGLIGAVLLLVGWRVSKGNVTIGTPLALTGALGMVMSPALSGHAASSRHFVLSVTLDITHVAAAGIWVGGLLLVLIVGVPAMRRLTDGNTDAAVSALVNSFHPLALFCAPIVVVAGMSTAWIRLGSVSALSSDYGRTLIGKVVFVALVASMGTYNALRARRRLGVPEGTRHFRVSAAVELVFAAMVVVATTYLVTMPVPSEMVMP